MGKTEKKIRKLNHKVQDIISRDYLKWGVKYDKIFSDKISVKVHDLINLDYCDPDTSYEEDVLAFANALNEYVLDNYK